MTQPDPGISTRDIHTLSEEHQTAGADLVADLYWHLVDRNGRAISIDEGREYIGKLTARFPREILRSWLDRMAPGSFARARRSQRQADDTADDARRSEPGRHGPSAASGERAQRKSLLGQDDWYPDRTNLLSRAAGRDPSGLTNAELLARAAGSNAAALRARRIAPSTSEPPGSVGARVGGDGSGARGRIVSGRSAAGGGRSGRVAQAASVNLDLTTDPLIWPLGEGSPTTEAEWAIEYAVMVERMREEPQGWHAKRWPLPKLATDPLPDFKRRFVTLWRYSFLPHAEGLPATPNHYILQRMDLLVSDERNRQIRERLLVAGGPVNGPPPRSRRRGRPSWHRDVFDEHYEAAVRDARSAAVRIVAKHFRALDGNVGIDPSSLARLLRRRTLPPGVKDAMPE
jgi:hypothetical protein